MGSSWKYIFVWIMDFKWKIGKILRLFVCRRRLLWDSQRHILSPRMLTRFFFSRTARPPTAITSDQTENLWNNYRRSNITKSCHDRRERFSVLRFTNIMIYRFKTRAARRRVPQTNPGPTRTSMRSGEYGLKRGACFVARRLEVVAVTVIL